MKITKSLIGKFVLTYNEEGFLSHAGQITGIDVKGNLVEVAVLNWVIGVVDNDDYWHPSLLDPPSLLFASRNAWRVEVEFEQDRAQKEWDRREREKGKPKRRVKSGK